MASIHKERDGGYRGVLYKDGQWVCDMVVEDQDGQLRLREFLLLESPPVVYFRSSELLLLGQHGMFRRLDCKHYRKR